MLKYIYILFIKLKKIKVPFGFPQIRFFHCTQLVVGEFSSFKLVSCIN